MKLIHRTITALGIATLFSGLNHTVHAQSAVEETSTPVAQMNPSGYYNQGPGGFNPGNFNPGGDFNQFSNAPSYRLS